MSEYSNILLYSDNYNIIGEKDQVLQFLLKNDESLICKKQNISYSSKNLSEYDYNLINENNIVKHDQIKEKGNIIFDHNLVYIKNKQNNFEYIGLYNTGKIINIIPELYRDLIIKYHNCLAFSKNIDLLEKIEITNKIKPFNKNEIRNTFYNKHQNLYCLVYANHDLFEKILTEDLLKKKDFLFLSSQSILFILY